MYTCYYNEHRRGMLYNLVGISLHSSLFRKFLTLIGRIWSYVQVVSWKKCYTGIFVKRRAKLTHHVRNSCKFHGSFFLFRLHSCGRSPRKHSHTTRECAYTEVSTTYFPTGYICTYVDVLVTIIIFIFWSYTKYFHVLKEW